MSRHTRYNATENGIARKARYTQSEKGKAGARARQARYRATLKGVQADARAEFVKIIKRAKKEG